MTIGRRPPPAPGAASVDAVALAGSERPASAAPEPTSMDLPFRGAADGRRLANPAATREIFVGICGLSPWHENAACLPPDQSEGRLAAIEIKGRTTHKPQCHSVAALTWYQPVSQSLMR